MTAPVWIDHAEDAPETFYAPDFKIEAGPTETQLATVGDVSRVSFKDSVNEIDSFEFTVADAGWAPGVVLHTASVVNRAEVAEDAGPSGSLLPGTRVRLWMGYRSSELFPMLTGRVVAVSPTYGPGDAGSITVRCLGTIEALREAPRSQRWEPARGASAVRDIELAGRIAHDHDIEFVPPAGLAEPGHATISQNDETDLAFLVRRATERGYIICFRETATTGGGTQRRMYFGPSNYLGAAQRQLLGAPAAPYELRWGASLVDFRPTINLSTTVWQRVKLSFWDRRRQRREVRTFSIEDLWAREQNINCDVAPLIDEAAIAEHELSNRAVHTREEADTLLENTLRENFLAIVTAQGTTVGLPELRACSQVEVRGLGAPFNGTWFVTSTTHSLDDSGYTTRFEARREQRQAACA